MSGLRQTCGAFGLLLACAGGCHSAPLSTVPGEVQWSPLSLAFAAAPGTSSQLALTLTTSSTTPVQISSVAISHDVRSVFSVAHSVLQIAAGAPVTLSVVYAPPASGTDDALLQILTDSSNTPTIDVPLHGVSSPSQGGSTSGGGSSGGSPTSGATGTTGTSGSSGSTGTTGTTGSSGSTGTTGTTGSSGATGTTGTSGSTGTTGAGSGGSTGGLPTCNAATGSADGGVSVTVIAQAQEAFYAQVDSGSLYWTAGETVSGVWYTDIWSLDLAAGAPVKLASVRSPQGPGQFTLDANNVYVVAADSANPGSIVAVSRTGGPPVTLASGVSGLVSNDPLVADSSNLYFADFNQDTVMELPLGGGTPTSLASAQDTFLLARDAANLYWITWSGAFGGSSITADLVQMPLGVGGAPSTLTTIVPPSGANVSAGGLAVGSGKIVWTTGAAAGGTVELWDLATSKQSTLASTLPNPTAVALDSCFAYWINYASTASLMKVPLTGGPPTTLTSSLTYPTGLTVDATSVYVVDYGAGQIVKVTPK
ncbi:MAG: NHL repeat-containing protein [Deltaproteobacteria bacterium]